MENPYSRVLDSTQSKTRLIVDKSDMTDVELDRSDSRLTDEDVGELQGSTGDFSN